MESPHRLTMCRLCLIENERFVNIFETKGWHGYVAAEAISDLLQFKVSKKDAYPHVLCSVCLATLTDFKLFKERCRTAKITYENVFAPNEDDVDRKSSKDKPTGRGSAVKETGVVARSGVVTRALRTNLRNQAAEKKPKQEPPHVIKEEAVDFVEDGEPNAQDLSHVIKHESIDIVEDGEPESQFIIQDVKSVSVEDVVKLEECSEEAVARGLEKFEEDPLRESASEEQEDELITVTVPGSKRKKYKCKHCLKLLKSKESLKGHILVIHGFGSSFDCEVCGKKFPRNNDLRRHAVLHTGNRPFKCNECPSSFTENGKLVNHMRIHSGLKPFPCRICKAAFRYRSSLIAHQSTHSGVRPFKCEVCSKDFVRRTHLNRHLRVHTGGMAYQCSRCSKQFRRRENLKKHMELVCSQKC